MIYGNSENPTFHKLRSREMAVLLTKYGADIRVVDKGGDTALHRIQFREVVHFLVSQGADVNARDKDGNTPLHYASRGKLQGTSCNQEMTRDQVAEALRDVFLNRIDALLEAGADMTMRNNAGQLPNEVALEDEVGAYLMRRIRESEK